MKRKHPRRKIKPVYTTAFYDSAWCGYCEKKIHIIAPHGLIGMKVKCPDCKHILNMRVTNVKSNHSV